MEYPRIRVVKKETREQLKDIEIDKDRQVKHKVT